MPKSSQNERVCALEMACNAASAADMFDFQQSLMSVGGSKLAEMDLMFVDPGVKDQWCTLPYKSLRL